MRFTINARHITRRQLVWAIIFASQSYYGKLAELQPWENRFSLLKMSRQKLFHILFSGLSYSGKANVKQASLKFLGLAKMANMPM